MAVQAADTYGATFFAKLSKEEIALIASDAAFGNVDAKYFYVLYLVSTNASSDGDMKRLRLEAAAAGHPSAESDQCLLDALPSEGMPPSTENCFRAAFNGNPNAQNFLGLLLSIGMSGLKEDAPAALGWYRMAAFQGDSTALLTVGNQYNYGTGVEKDAQLAIHYWERAASQDNPEALRQLGRAYAVGAGVPADADKASAYFNRASDLGDGPSQYYLGLLYRFSGNFQSAYVMQTIALKTVEAGEMRDGIVKERIALQALLSPEQIRTASKFARAWRKKKAKAAPFIGGTDFVKRLQKELNKRGFKAGEEDGIAGGATRKAYRQYADVLHLPNAGFSSPDVYYVAYRLNLYGLVQPSPPPMPAPVEAAQQAPMEPAQDAPNKPSLKTDVVSTGSGFVVDHKGHVVTNAHVAKQCTSVGIVDQQGNKITAKTIKVSAFSDLALLRSDDLKESPSAAFRGGEPIRLGESVVVFGFPLAGTLSDRGNLTVGNLAALSGLRDDPGMLQISAPVQPGNSGGPVLDSHGRLVGVVVAKLNAIAVANVTDDIPQNVNFAIKSSVLENFLQASAVEYQTEGGSTKELPITDLARLAQHISVRVECYGPL
ncbi:trypsin-like peptidase domain-containing protein [Mesorhizobium sp.]|uniref:trypsin-like peptidase domain-containing protein n=1 Tax=Mesorhizobium sp. TaxID=1871066 RepID=UPI000FE954DE|nr:trypsin-like peptidase domain-containing protein [Mesorhizobium sp.]RWQ21407.1 MAG: trypsin-like serine protease [Mesorhizobium sp.]